MNMADMAKKVLHGDLDQNVNEVNLEDEKAPTQNSQPSVSEHKKTEEDD